jgi:hypothetical protein
VAASEAVEKQIKAGRRILKIVGMGLRYKPYHTATSFFTTEPHRIIRADRRKSVADFEFLCDEQKLI